MINGSWTVTAGPRVAAADESAAGSTAAELMAAALQHHGVEQIFAQSLPSALILAAEDLGIRQVAYRTENAGGAMADGYARCSNKIGVVAAQNGPAATLLVPPLAEALKSSVPVLALVQDVDRPNLDRNAFQELDHLGLFQGCTKWVRRVQDAERVEEYVSAAMVAASTGRPGPVALLLPADLLKEETTTSHRRRRIGLGTWPIDRSSADPESVRQVARLLSQAKQPVVIAGGGVLSSQAAEELSALQDLASLPVGTTLMGKGSVDEQHPLSLGVLGALSGRLSLGHQTSAILAEADFVLLVGTRTNQNGTDSWKMIPPQTVVAHLDVDGLEVGRNYDSLRLVGDAKLTLQSLISVLRREDLSERSARRSDLERRIGSAKARHADETNDLRHSVAAPIRPERVMGELQKRLRPEDIVVADASYSSMWVGGYLTALAPGMRFLTPRGLAGLGWGFPMALGAKLARPERSVFCFVGDGGFGHCWQELETARRMDIKVILTVLNNGVLGYQKDAEDVKFGRHTSACTFADVDHRKIAEACGCLGFRVERADDYGDALDAAAEADRPSLIEVMTDPLAYPPLTLFDGALGATREHKETSGSGAS